MTQGPTSNNPESGEKKPSGSSDHTQAGSASKSPLPDSSQSNFVLVNDSEPGIPKRAPLPKSDKQLPAELAAERDKAKTIAPRTMLDHDLIREAAKKMTAEHEFKVLEELRNKPKEPIKPFVPIENFKPASPCEYTWKKSDPKQRCSFCEKCQQHVYDFDGIELPEANELILKRENRQVDQLFKRADGMFLTTDCPLAARRKMNQIMLIAGGVLVVGITLAILLMLPKPQAHTEAAVDAEPPQAITQPVQPQKASPIQAQQSQSSQPQQPNQSQAASPTSLPAQPYAQPLVKATPMSEEATSATPEGTQNNQASSASTEQASQPVAAPAPASTVALPQMSTQPAPGPAPAAAPASTQAQAAAAPPAGDPPAPTTQTPRVQYFGR